MTTQPETPPNGLFWEDEDAEGVLAGLFGLKRLKRRDGQWIAEYFGGTEAPLVDEVRRARSQAEVALRQENERLREALQQARDRLEHILEHGGEGEFGESGTQDAYFGLAEADAALDMVCGMREALEPIHDPNPVEDFDGAPYPEEVQRAFQVRLHDLEQERAELAAQVEQLRDALRDVIAESDRDTDSYVRAKAALALPASSALEAHDAAVIKAERERLRVIVNADRDGYARLAELDALLKEDDR
jgi:hypothetical protein